MVSINPDIDNSYCSSIKHISIPISEIHKGIGNRFDASFYCTEGRTARKKIDNCHFELTNLSPDGKLVEKCVYPSRFKRIYVDQEYGVGFYLPSQISEINPKPEKFISKKTEANFDELKVEKNSLLLTRSGTIGNITYVSDTFAGKVFSDDVIRIYFRNIEDAGYVYAFLKHKIGHDILVTNSYGAVVQHIEPSHLSEVRIPNPSLDQKKKIHKLVIDSFNLRDESNRLVEEAERILLSELRLPPLNSLKYTTFVDSNDVVSYTVPASKLMNRFDGSFHVPIINAIEEHIFSHSKRVASLGEEAISKKIILPGRFKRVYVEDNYGIPFFGGKQIYDLIPSEIKYLSKIHHSERVRNQLALRENMILVTCSGTIGKVAIVPKQLAGWAANQHILRIVPSNIGIAGYIYSWLNSSYGEALINKYTYGAVVDEIDDKQLAQVPIPLIDDNLQRTINDLVLDANRKRYESYLFEKEAISEIDNLFDR